MGEIPKMIQNDSKMITSENPLKFSCEICSYSTNNKKDFLKHCGTKKHDTKWYLPTQNQKKYFECNNCDYISANFNHMYHHITSLHHTSQHDFNGKKSLEEFSIFYKQNDNSSCCIVFNDESGISSEIKKIDTAPKKYYCDYCSCKYAYKSGYYRHIKHCPNKQNKEFASMKSENKELMQKLLESTETNNKLCEKLLDLETNRKDSFVQNQTINNNQKVNINVFLNQECKDAMTIQDFIDTLKLSVDDLNYTKANGYIKGITNILLKNLEEISITQRPIHTVKSEFYVKDEDKWEWDQSSEKINSTINTVARKQINKIKEWEHIHPDWNSSDQGIEEYIKVVKNVMGGSTDEESLFNLNAIKQKLKHKTNMNSKVIGLLEK